MMLTLRLFVEVLAAVCFLISALGTPTVRGYNLQSLGLFLWLLAVIAPL